jgi:hypothetical protein
MKKSSVIYFFLNMLLFYRKQKLHLAGEVERYSNVSNAIRNTISLAEIHEEEAVDVTDLARCSPLITSHVTLLIVPSLLLLLSIVFRATNIRVVS